MDLVIIDLVRIGSPSGSVGVPFRFQCMTKSVELKLGFEYT